MIRCKLVESLNPDAGHSVATVNRVVAGESLSVGRAASCKVYLPDTRVRLEHATVRRAEDGFLYLEAAGPVFVNQRLVTSVRLSQGQAITIGPYDFAVEAVEDGLEVANPSLTLSFKQRQGAPSLTERLEAVAAGQLRPSWITRRRLSWLLALSVLLLCAVLPIWRVYQPQPALAQVMLEPGLKRDTLHWANGAVARMVTFWNPGQISSAHQNFVQDCRACHVQPFERVADASCTTCHKATGAHVTDKSLDQATFQGQRCASCHKEHQGTAGMRTADTMSCEQCHGDIKRFSPRSTLADASDFARDHPAFRLSIRQPGKDGPVQRVLQTANLRNDTGLKFGHAIHLAKAGIKSPSGPRESGGRVVLECASCHRLDAAGTRYEPVRMGRDCQACHRLSVDPQAPEREVPHAVPAEVNIAVREIYASLAVDRYPVSLVTVNTLLQRPAARAAPGTTTSAARWVEQQSELAMASMFELPTGVCKTCHVTEKRPDTSGAKASWQVRPVVATDHWLPKSRFSHAQHKNAQCASCHAAELSKSAADILIPDLKVCQACHAGAQATTVKGRELVVSRCDSCHAFHSKVDHPALAGAAAGKAVQP